jgi:hypothetical protein
LPNTRRPSPTRRRVAFATGLVAALAIAAPVADASTSTEASAPPSVVVSLPDMAGLQASIQQLLASVGVSGPAVVISGDIPYAGPLSPGPVVKAPTVSGTVFHGPTTVVVSPSPAVGITNGP